MNSPTMIFASLLLVTMATGLGAADDHPHPVVGSDQRPSELERRQGEIRGELGTADKRDSRGPDSGVGRVEPRLGGQKDPRETLGTRSTDNETGVDSAAEKDAVDRARQRHGSEQPRR